MDAERAERLIAAAFRGMMQGILDSEGAPSRSPRTRKQAVKGSLTPVDAYPQAPDFTVTPTMTASDVEILAAVRAAMNEGTPPTDAGPPDLFGLLQQQEAAHTDTLRMTQAQTQPGPGEDEGRRWPGVD